MRIGTALAGLLLAGACLANQVQESKVDAQTRELARELRCTVCQSETLWESNSTLAQQMRALIRDSSVRKAALRPPWEPLSWEALATLTQLPVAYRGKSSASAMRLAP